MASNDYQEIRGSAKPGSRSEQAQPRSRASGSWPLAIGLVLLGAGLLAGIAWRLLPPRDEVVALLKIFRANPSTLEMPNAISRMNSDFDVYKRTPVALFKSHLVMQATLRKPKVAGLPIIQRQKDPIGWLTRELKVDFPGDAEILRIAMQGDNTGGQLVTLVNEVKDSYMDEIVNGEAADRVKARQQLESSLSKNQADIQGKSRTLRELEKQAGAGDAAVLKKRIALARMDELVRKAWAVDSEIAEIEMRLSLLEPRTADVDTARPHPGAREVAMHIDPQIEQTMSVLDSLKASLTELAKATVNPNEPLLQRMGEEIETLQRVLRAKRRQSRSLAEGNLALPPGKLPAAWGKAPDCEQLKKDLRVLERNMTEAMRVATNSNDPGLARIREQVDAVREELEVRTLDIKKELEERQGLSDLTAGGLGFGISKETLEIQLEALQDEKTQLAEKVQHAIDAVMKIEDTTAEIESRKAELRNLEDITKNMAKELVLWDLNMSAANNRIVLIDDAHVEAGDDTFHSRVGMGIAGMVGFGLALVAAACVQRRFDSRPA